MCSPNRKRPERSDQRSLIAVHVGALDDPSTFTPRVVTYSSSGRSWDSIDASLTAFATRPGAAAV